MFVKADNSKNIHSQLIKGTNTMVHQNELDIALINQWVLVHDPRQTMKMDAERLGVAADYFVGFFYVDATAGMSLHIETYCTIAADTINSTKGPRDLNSRTVMRVTTFKDFTVRVLSEIQRKALNLPDEPDWLHFYKVDCILQYSARNLNVR